MGVLCRACAAGILIGLGSIAALYVMSPETTVDMLNTQTAVVQVRLQAFAESASDILAEKSALAFAFGNSSSVAFWQRFKVARSEGHVLAGSCMKLGAESAAVIKLKLDDLGGSVFRTGGEYASQVKMMLSKHFEGVSVAQMLRKLYDSILPAMEDLKASVVSISQRVIDQAPDYASSFADFCRASISYFKDSMYQATPLQLTAAIILGPIVLYLVLWTTELCLRALFRTLCCRRREVVAMTMPRDARTEIMMAPSPLRERFPRSTQAPQRRRRSESPGAVAKENGASEANFEVASEQELLTRLNTATEEELRLMPGLGDKSISKILKYRSKAGGLESVDDLVSKVGIHGATFANFAKAQGI